MDAGEAVMSSFVLVATIWKLDDSGVKIREVGVWEIQAVLVESDSSQDTTMIGAVVDDVGCDLF